MTDALTKYAEKLRDLSMKGLNSGPFSNEEKEKFNAAFAKYGTSDFQKVAEYVGCRTALQCKRFYMLMKLKANK